MVQNKFHRYLILSIIFLYKSLYSGQLFVRCKEKLNKTVDNNLEKTPKLHRKNFQVFSSTGVKACLKNRKLFEYFYKKNLPCVSGGVEQLEKFVKLDLKTFGFNDVYLEFEESNTGNQNICVLGKQIRIEKIEIRFKNNSFDQKKLFRVKTPCFLPELNKAKSNALTTLKQQGYWNSSIKINYYDIPDADYSTENIQPIAAIIDIDFGNKAKFGDIFYQGNFSLDLPIIQKMVLIKNGQVWDSNLIFKTKNNLEETGLFSKVYIIPQQASNNCLESSPLKPNHIPLSIILEEDLEKEVKFSFGLAFDEKNFSIKNKVPLQFGNEICFSKNSFLIPYDRINIMASFDSQKNSIRGEYSYGQANNIPVQISNFLAFEQSSNFFSGNPQGYKSTSFCTNFIKNMTPLVSGRLLFGFQQIKGLEDCANNNKFIAEPVISFENVQGGFFREQGYGSSIKLTFLHDFVDTDQSLFSSSAYVFHHQLISESISFSSKMGLGFANNSLPFYKKAFYKKKDKALLFEQDPWAYINIANQQDVNLLDSLNFTAKKKDFVDIAAVERFLTDGANALFLSAELKKLMFSNFGLACFGHIKLQDFTTPKILAGVSFRTNIFCCKLLFDAGWNFSSQTAFWRLYFLDGYF